MYGVLIVKLLGGPTAILLASMAGRRWGPAAAGMLGGMPLLAACVVGALWLEYGRDYALDIASAAPAGLWANSAFMLTMAYASCSMSWRVMVACGWIVYFAIACLIAFSGFSNSLWMALSALGSLVAAISLMPSPSGPPKIINLPRMEMLARMTAAFVMVAGLSLASQGLGPTLTGVLSGFPVVPTVIPAFTLAAGDRNAVLIQLRGFLAGRAGFSISFLVLVAFGREIGAWAVFPAVLSALATTYAINWAAHRWMRTGMRGKGLLKAT